MSLRMLDLAFRHKVLLVVPILLGLLLGIGWFVSSMEDEYVSSASIRVQRQPFEPTAVDFNPYLSAAQNQTEAMQELLTTRTFTDSVVDAANVASTGCGTLPLTAGGLIAGTSMGPTGNRFVRLAFRSTSPCLAQHVVQALYDKYTEVFDTLIQSNAQQARDFYQGQLERATEAQNAAKREFSSYVSGHPDLAGIADLTELPASAAGDAELARLFSAVQNADDNYSLTLGRLQDATAAANSSSSSSSSFELYDAPEIPTAPLALGTRAVMTKPFMGLALGLLISAGVFFILWRMDRAVRLPSDLAFLGTRAPVMTLPSLRARRRHWPQSFVRLAAGITSGLTHLG